MKIADKITLLNVRAVFVLLTTLLLCGCGGKRGNVDNNRQIMVSIEPLKYFVEEIVGSDFEISVIVPSGEGPETYSPTPSQAARIEKAEMVFLTGLLNFEHELMGDNMLNDRHIYTVSKSVNLIGSTHSHSHNSANQDHHNEAVGVESDHSEDYKVHSEDSINSSEEVDHRGEDSLSMDNPEHIAGADPHIWLSLRELQQIVANITDVIITHYPDSTKYAERGQKICERLEQVDNQFVAAFVESGVSAFAIYHPALSYYARDYGLEQIAIEDEGKEPNLARLKSAIDRSKQLGISKIFYQIEYPVSVVENFANDLGAEPIAINPLSGQIVDELCRITTLLTGVEF